MRWTGWLAGWCTAEGELPFHRYHLAPADIVPGDVMLAGKDAPVRPGSVLPLRDIPIGVPVHNVELRPGRGGQLARAAHTSAMIQSKQEDHAIVKLPSGAAAGQRGWCVCGGGGGECRALLPCRARRATKGVRQAIAQLQHDRGGVLWGWG